jgi:serine/threonine protein kinase
MFNRVQPATTSNFEIPETIGPFRLLRLLGEGGMGAVYLAERREQFSQHVAIKVFYPHLFPASADAKMRREGQLLAALEHPGIVRMLDLGVSESGLRFLVMEYVDGVPIDAFCNQHRLPLRRRIEILLDVLDAVEHAHRHLVVHADLKPENILVTGEGKPRLLDFGVATILSKNEDPADAAHGTESPDSLEGSHTPLFASPEQRSGARLTVAGDIYSLGLIALSLLAGVQPGTLPVGILHDQSAVSPAPCPSRALRQLDPESLGAAAAARATSPAGLEAAIQGDLDAVLGKALRLNPAERFQSVQEMRNEFERYLLGYPVLTRPAGWWTRSRKWALRNKLAASLGCVFLLVVVFSILGVIRQAAEAAQKRQIAQTRLHELVRLTDVLAGDLYESVHGLQGAEAAQAALLDSAHKSIDKLAADDSQDTQLDLELAREYEKLARLELNRTPLTAESLNRCDQDMLRESGILDRVASRDPEEKRLRENLAKTRQLRNAAAQKQGH